MSILKQLGPDHDVMTYSLLKWSQLAELKIPNTYQGQQLYFSFIMIYMTIFLEFLKRSKSCIQVEKDSACY